MHVQLTAVFQQVPEGYIAFVEELPGANTQGDTLEEARSNLAEAIEIVLETNRALAEEELKGKDVIREQIILAAWSASTCCAILRRMAASFYARAEVIRFISILPHAKLRLSRATAKSTRCWRAKSAKTWKYLFHKNIDGQSCPPYISLNAPSANSSTQRTVLPAYTDCIAFRYSCICGR